MIKKRNRSFNVRLFLAAARHTQGKLQQHQSAWRNLASGRLKRLDDVEACSEHYVARSTLLLVASFGSFSSTRRTVSTDLSTPAGLGEDRRP